MLHHTVVNLVLSYVFSTSLDGIHLSPKSFYFHHNTNSGVLESFSKWNSSSWQHVAEKVFFFNIYLQRGIWLPLCSVIQKNPNYSSTDLLPFFKLGRESLLPRKYIQACLSHQLMDRREDPGSRWTRGHSGAHSLRARCGTLLLKYLSNVYYRIFD